MKTCGHDGPHYRITPKGRPGVFWCKQCIMESTPEQWAQHEGLESLLNDIEDFLRFLRSDGRDEGPGSVEH